MLMFISREEHHADIFLLILHEPVVRVIKQPLNHAIACRKSDGRSNISRHVRYVAEQKQ